jgi:hypothetical protein
MSSPSCRTQPGRLVAATHITGAADALGVIEVVRSKPSRPELIALVLEQRRGHTVFVVDDAVDPDAIVTVVELLGQSLISGGRPGELVVATVRPGAVPLPGDADRWMEASSIAEDLWCELLEWFVIDGHVAWCPRDVLAEAPRW